MSCTNHTQPTQQTTESLGGVDVDKNKEPLITYKYLILTPDRQFVSPVSGSLWGDLSMAGVAKDEDATPDWVWSCLSPDNLELKNYQRNDSVLVTLQVWGKVIIGDNGVVRSQHARIIGYDTNDYYLALLYHEKVNIQNIKEIVDPKKLIRKVIDWDCSISAQDVIDLLEKAPDPEFAYLLGKKHNLDICRRISCQNPQYAFKYAFEIDRGPRDNTRAAVCQDPEYAYHYAHEVDQHPHDDTRMAACKNPQYAYQYAYYVDQHPRDDTRLAACKNPEYAYRYALNIDQQPRDDTRKAACKNYQYAYWYAKNVDRCPRDDTRKVACRSPLYAWLYARDVDKQPRDDTRLAACKNPEYAYRYALNIDQQPRDDTRKAACQSPRYAWLYARDVDQQPRDDTREAACKDPKFASRYARDVDQQPRDDTREAACKDPEAAYWYAVKVDQQYHPLAYQSAKQKGSWGRKYQAYFRGQIPRERRRKNQ